MDVLVFVINGSLESPHGEHELLDLQAQLLHASLHLLELPAMRVAEHTREGTSSLHFLLIVCKLEALLLEIPHSLFEVLVFPLSIVRAIRQSPLLCGLYY